ncbi:methyltransferase small domain-containing protein [Xylaria sp. CBS 124048]|nr:methyltransferase small domain-containing protein [Xylaria sp. CBS 124048]
MAPTDPSTTIRYLPTTEAYNKWAAVYDTDNNFLQALDTQELKTLFPRFLRSIHSPKPWRLVDLGCGTGRNTKLLLNIPHSHSDSDSQSEVIALDASEGMIRVAQSSLAAADGENPTNVKFALFDLSTTSTTPPSSMPLHAADALISTLVLEHVPLPAFFAHAARLLRLDGVLLLTNMHAHMGGISRAGFVDTDSGVKIRPRDSFAHTVDEVVAEARRHGFEVDGDEGILERTVGEDMVEDLGMRSKKWVGITCWFGGVFRKVPVG